MDADRSGRGDLREIEVELPPDLLDEMDDYAVRNGYRSPSAVVRAALDAS